MPIWTQTPGLGRRSRTSAPVAIPASPRPPAGRAGRQPLRAVTSARALALGLGVAVLTLPAATAQAEAAAERSARAQNQQPALPEGAVASYQSGGETQFVPEDALALELAQRERLRERGQLALEHIVHRELVARAAETAGISATREEIDAEVRKVEKQLEAHGQSLASFLREKAISRAAFEQDYIALSIVHEKLVVATAGLRSRAQVSQELLKLWLEEARTKANVETDATKLGPGIVARVGKRQLSLTDLGDVLLQNASDTTRQRYVQQIVIRALIDQAARENQISVSSEEIDAEVLRRRKLIEADPAFRGIPYEQLLQSQGTTVEALRESPVLRAQVQRQKLGDVLFSTNALTAELEADRSRVLRDHGARRFLNVILIRAMEEPNQFVQIDFDQAATAAAAVRKRIAEEGMSFATAARIHSDDPESKVKGGAVGLHGHDSDELPKKVIQAAYHLDPYVVSEPIRTEEGFYLVMVSEIEDQPTDAVLIQRMRTTKMRTWLENLLHTAEIRVKGIS